MEEVTSEASVQEEIKAKMADFAELIALWLRPCSNKEVRNEIISDTDACSGSIFCLVQKLYHFAQYVLYCVTVESRQAARMILAAIIGMPELVRLFLIIERQSGVVCPVVDDFGLGSVGVVGCWLGQVAGMADRYTSGELSQTMSVWATGG